MTIPSPEPEKQPRDSAYWAEEATALKVERTPTGALNLNVEGHEVLSPLQGFGQLWQKVYRAHVKNATVTPDEIVKVWKERFSEFWPKGNRFYAPPTDITPGAVAILSVGMPRVPVSLGMISTGVFVLYADEESFTFMTPTVHLFASWITFSVYQEDDWTVIQIHMLLRPNDPLYELGMRLRVIPFFEDRFWSQTLINLMASPRRPRERTQHYRACHQIVDTPFPSSHHDDSQVDDDQDIGDKQAWGKSPLSIPEDGCWQEER